MTIESHRDLKVWQKAIDPVVAVSGLARQFPPDEHDALTSPIRRATVSVASTSAEGHGRGSSKSFLQFLWIANGSLKEVETHLVIAGRLGYISRDQAQPVYDQFRELGRMLTGLRRALSGEHGIANRELVSASAPDS